MDTWSRRNPAVVIAELVIVTLMLAASGAAAAVTATWLGPLASSPALTSDIGVEHVVGLIADPVGWLQASEAYHAYVAGLTFHPKANACPCRGGFVPTAYHLVIAKVGAEPVNAQFTLTLGDAWKLDLYPPGTVCFDPPSGFVGPRYSYGFYCRTGVETAVLVDEGWYELRFTGLPTCGCVSLDYAHAMLMYPWYATDWGTSLFLAIDDAPDHCPDYYANPSMGHLWFTGIEAPGNLIMWADASCCEPAVATMTLPWGSLKVRYR